uniref:LRAT domain-containing protein n=1 Tax=uncultured bacterium fosmid pJB84G2 TaxID=1478072 RepID=A0A0H3UAQ9_9BACT|nr:hypothetical protein [uncultured bacterium fosmid pJB84G2]
MKWVIAPLIEGDHIRVKRDFYYHHGIYIGNDEAIHFTGSEGDSISSPEKVSIMRTSMDFFSKGEIVEKAELDKKEKKYLYKRDRIVKTAINSVGEKGYDILHNNCEDFANRICYKKSLSSQLDDFKKKI